MRPILEHIAYEGSFFCERFEGEAFDCPWHVHPEVEVLMIDSGTGRRLAGDALGRYAPGDLYLFAPHLPHLFHSDTAPDEPPSDQPRNKAPSAYRSVSRYTQFRPDCFGDGFFEQPELRSVKRLIDRAQRGLYFGHHTPDSEAAHRLGQTLQAQGPDRVAALIQLLAFLVGCPAQTLAGARYDPAAGRAVPDRDAQRLGRAIDYIHEHLTDNLSLAAAANAAALSPGGFSRAFRREYGRSFTDFVIDLRLGEACRLLLETDRPIVDVCFASGFANLSNFNRQFQKRRGTTPSTYRRTVS
ncbi:MAG: AraC family transcriptional regulator [Planctomycetota bacterium]